MRSPTIFAGITFSFRTANITRRLRPYLVLAQVTLCGFSRDEMRRLRGLGLSRTKSYAVFFLGRATASLGQSCLTSGEETLSWKDMAEESCCHISAYL